MLEKKKKQTGKKESKAARQGHDIIVIGASAGGVEALVDLAGQFPPDLPASVFIVLHVAPYPPSTLPDILSKAGPLPASHAIHGEPIERGHIYVAPSDSHMTLQEGSLRVVRGPKENGHRPAVDPLFRTAARRYRSRVIGVVLSGALDCGTAGLMVIKSFGGLAVVQDPKDALYSDMPRSAIDHVKVDHVVPISGMGALLARLAGEEARENGAEGAPKMNRRRENEEGKENNKISSITCP
ncbi:MAG TPA: chemotaxis protein CheB, partial [Candidatus Manganitrophaceae bacterium]|nr:chemotaxis protein CheB [Candidatus Manganitrophaceae bacterium]